MVVFLTECTSPYWLRHEPSRNALPKRRACALTQLQFRAVKIKISNPRPLDCKMVRLPDFKIFDTWRLLGCHPYAPQNHRITSMKRFQWHNRESNPQTTDLKLSALPNCATVCTSGRACCVTREDTWGQKGAQQTWYWVIFHRFNTTEMATGHIFFFVSIRTILRNLCPAVDHYL